MGIEIETTAFEMDGKEFLLVDVIEPAENLVGICPVMPFITNRKDALPYTETMYIGDEPIIVMHKKHRTDVMSDKLITQISAQSSPELQKRFAYATESYFTHGQMLTRALAPILEILAPGLYVVHVSRMIPTDGNKNYFLNAYSLRREVKGSAEVNSVIGADKTFTAPFLVPTRTITDYTEQRYNKCLDFFKQGRHIGGLAYHISGLFCALLEGHHAAMACVMADRPFNCIVIEPVRTVIYEDAREAKRAGRTPHISGVACPYARIPIEMLPEEMLLDFLTVRREARPYRYSIIRLKLRQTLRTMARKKYDQEVYTKISCYPDVPMIESLGVVDKLSEDDLECLLLGNVKDDNGRIIINENHYNSIVTACNFLQYRDFHRMISFAKQILLSEKLKAVHRYIVERLATLADNERVYRLFLEVYGRPVKKDPTASIKPLKTFDGMAEQFKGKSIKVDWGGEAPTEEELKEAAEATSGASTPGYAVEEDQEQKRMQSVISDLKEISDDYITEYENLQFKKKKRGFKPAISDPEADLLLAKNIDAATVTAHLKDVIKDKNKDKDKK